MRTIQFRYCVLCIRIGAENWLRIFVLKNDHKKIKINWKFFHCHLHHHHNIGIIIICYSHNLCSSFDWYLICSAARWNSINAFHNFTHDAQHIKTNAKTSVVQNRQKWWMVSVSFKYRSAPGSSGSHFMAQCSLISILLLRAQIFVLLMKYFALQLLNAVDYWPYCGGNPKPFSSSPFSFFSLNRITYFMPLERYFSVIKNQFSLMIFTFCSSIWHR